LARYRHTFDAFLRRRSENLLTSGLKHSTRTRQKPVRPVSSEKFLAFTPQTETSAQTRRARLQRLKVSSFAYYSKRQRLLSRRGNSVAVLAAVKRRALSVPSLELRRDVQVFRKASPRLCISNSALLQTALYDYYSSRRLRDLRKFARRRRGFYGTKIPF